MIKAVLALFLAAGSSLLASDLNRFSLRPLYWASLAKPAVPLVRPDPEELKKLEKITWLEHKVASSDHVWKLAKMYGTSVASLQSTNAAELVWIKPGSVITVLNKRGTLHQVRPRGGSGGETLSDIARNYAKEPDAQMKLKERIIQANRLPGYYLVTDASIPAGKYLFVPDAYFEFDTFRVPFKTGARISSGFGLRRHPILGFKRFHEGLDLPQPYGTPVYASRSGRVIFAGEKAGYGLAVFIKHGDATTSRYGHLSKISVRAGQIVEARKSVIGRVGTTGLSTGPHLHFEIRDSRGRPINPRKKMR